ncbi:DEAD/DEAH box helicase [Algicola sagamiensis]|uniref:DEAD/DEAH box helicase n=1 Tax=Algicola sagamiensis TaxID=163869 RepID=UPI00037C61F5|nr:DEAD/DEAH box helicase [Algicola sagamiensis]
MNLNRDMLHPYQHRSVDFIKHTPFCALWVDMGLGKTVSTLTAIADFIADFEVSRVLIIAPLRVAQHTWPSEIHNWKHTQHLSFEVISGTPQARMEKLYRDTDIHLINRELVPWLVDVFKKEWPYDMVVIDESSSFKSYQAKRFKALKKTLPRLHRMVQLTGTPASNGLMDIWTQIFLLDKGERLGKTISKYRLTYFNQDYMGYNWTLREGAEDAIYEKLQDICLTLSAEDYLDLPKRVDNVIPIPLGQKQKRQYQDLERDFLLLLEEAEIEAVSAAALSGKLLQFCNGALYIDEAGRYEEIHTLKIDALKEIIEDANGPVLVAYNYKSDLARLKKAFPEAQTLDKSNRTIERWNEGKIDILLAHPASAGHGLNLQQGGSIIVWFGLNWSLELYQQFNGRLHRQGQTKPVIIHHLAVEDSVDMSLLKALAYKNTTQKALLDALKTDMHTRMEEAA